MQRAAIVVCIGFLFFGGTAWGQKKPKDLTVPGVILHARYVYVTAFTGDQFDPRLMPEDRRAISDVIDALKKWGRYAITYDQNNADLVLVVRKGKLAAVKVGGGVGVGSPGTVPFEVGSAELGSPDDTLLVMQGPGNPLDKPALWRRSVHNGLDGPNPALVAALKKDVEQAAAKKP